MCPGACAHAVRNGGGGATGAPQTLPLARSLQAGAKIHTHTSQRKQAGISSLQAIWTVVSSSANTAHADMSSAKSLSIRMAVCIRVALPMPVYGIDGTGVAPEHTCCSFQPLQTMLQTKRSGACTKIARAKDVGATTGMSVDQRYWLPNCKGMATILQQCYEYAAMYYM